MKSKKTMAKMYDFKNLIYYDNALYEHEHDHKNEKRVSTSGSTKKKIRENHNKGELRISKAGIFY